MTIKSLRYSHVCGGTTGDSCGIANLATEMEQKAVIALGARIKQASEEQASERLVEQQRARWVHLTGF